MGASKLKRKPELPRCPLCGDEPKTWVSQGEMRYVGCGQLYTGNHDLRVRGKTADEADSLWRKLCGGK